MRCQVSQYHYAMTQTYYSVHCGQIVPPEAINPGLQSHTGEVLGVILHTITTCGAIFSPSMLLEFVNHKIGNINIITI